MNDRKRFADVLRAEVAGVDLQEGPYGVHVFAMRQDRSVYELGSVSESMVYQNPAAAHAAISLIKFWRQRKPNGTPGLSGCNDQLGLRAGEGDDGNDFGLGLGCE